MIRAARSPESKTPGVPGRPPASARATPAIPTAAATATRRNAATKVAVAEKAFATPRTMTGSEASQAILSGEGSELPPVILAHPSPMGTKPEYPFTILDHRMHHIVS